jgi:pyocin large subunit-like protein
MKQKRLNWWQLLLGLLAIAAGGLYTTQKETAAPRPAAGNALQAPPQRTEAKNSRQPEAKPEPAAAEKKAPRYQVREWNRGNLVRHWEKHRDEFPELHSAEEYGEAALALFRTPPEQTLVKTRADGDRVYFHPPSGSFGAVTSDGYPKTFFRPDRGIQYWEKQQ